MVVPLFLLLLMGTVEGAWYVLEVSAITNSARTAARWEVVAENFGAGQQPACATPGTTAPLVSPARSTAGPFAAAISASSITNLPIYQTPDDSSTPLIGCEVTIKVTYQPLEALVRIGPSTISSTFTAYLN